MAMTGDGVNDVLALKDADLGVAMGSGAPATRAVAQIVLLDDKFATLPHVVAEGRRVLGNIERVAKLFLTKTTYSVLLALLVGVFGLQYPFLPIHVTITGWFTIGIPAFLLSLPPNNERARPGFVRRVIALAIPSGVIAGLGSFVTYVFVHPAPGADEIALRQSSTATLATMILISTWLLAVVARPYVAWRVSLVLGSLAAYALIFLLPVTQWLFLLDSSNLASMTTGLVVGLVGMACIEAVWWVSHLVRGERAVVWRRRV